MWCRPFHLFCHFPFTCVFTFLISCLIYVLKSSNASRYLFLPQWGYLRCYFLQPTRSIEFPCDTSFTTASYCQQRQVLSERLHFGALVATVNRAADPAAFLRCHGPFDGLRLRFLRPTFHTTIRVKSGARKQMQCEFSDSSACAF